MRHGIETELLARTAKAGFERAQGLHRRLAAAGVHRDRE